MSIRDWIEVCFCFLGDDRQTEKDFLDELFRLERLCKICSIYPSRTIKVF